MALAANRNLQERNIETKSRGSATVAAGQTIYKGSLVAILVADGTLVVCSDATTTIRGAGISEKQWAAGEVADYTYGHDVLLPMASGDTITNASINASMFAVDDETVGTTTTLGPAIGVLKERVSATSGWVRICGAALPANT
jgi:predicted secreted hydrolase